MKKLFTLIIIILIICSIFLQIETTTDKKSTLESYGIGDYISISNINNDIDAIPYIVENLDKIGQEKYHENNSLNFMDGVKNGFLIIGSYFRDVVVGSICGYLSGFYNNGIIVKVIWAILGLIIIPIKLVIISLFSTVKLAFSLLTQRAAISYYIGYVLSLIILVSILSGLNRNSNENSAENTE